MYHVGSMASSLYPLFNPHLRLVIPAYGLDLAAMMDTIEKYKCNVFAGLPKVLTNLLNHPDRSKYDLSSLTACFVGGQHITADLIQRTKLELGLENFLLGFGMSELGGGLSAVSITLSEFSPENYSNSLGEICPFSEAKIVNAETGQVQPFNEEGELHVRSYIVTRGYWNDEEMTRKLISPSRWLNTGDIFTMDSKGVLHFRSRRQEIITVAGHSM
jgi:acyl-CoA synthetase (AMP-forming)/AMP-acid ligase II